MPERWIVTPPAPRVEPTPRWVRVRAGDVPIADSRRALLLSWFGPGKLPTYCFPSDDVDGALLRPTPGAAPGPGGAEVHDVVGPDGAVLAAAAALRFGAPPEEIAGVAGHWTFSWDAGLTWLEEALEVHVHARDPRHRVDAVPSERHVRIELDGVVVAESRRPLAVFETDLPTRWYLRADDVRSELLVATDTVTRCPFKGTARYWSVRIGDAQHRDVVWSYPDPILEAPRLAGLLAFFDEHVDVVLDGVRQERPVTPWS
jgi:uncharacterized protein (DUF427 family)